MHPREQAERAENSQPEMVTTIRVGIHPRLSLSFEKGRTLRFREQSKGIRVDRRTTNKVFAPHRAKSHRIASHGTIAQKTVPSRDRSPLRSRSVAFVLLVTLPWYASH